MLLGILIVFLILMVRPFGFRTFLHGLGENNIFSLLLVVCIVGIILVILQRAGIIFSENTYA
jgi:glucan phosphoethanolaminetransferase (alkaline phosphatase superfamily)